MKGMGARNAVLASLALQLPLALFLGHGYDQPIFMATGYLASSGLNPYISQDLSGVFSNSLFRGLSSIGYFPPWPLLLGLIYKISFALVPSLFLYNLALKVPAIAATIGLAFVVRALSREAGAPAASCHRAFLFILFNPLLLYVTSAWGQFDTAVALVALASLYFMYKKRTMAAVALAAFAVALKPIAIALLPMSLLAARGEQGAGRRLASAAARIPVIAGRPIRVALAFSAFIAFFCAGPFLAFRWDPAPIFAGWNAHFTVAGGLSWLTFFELFGKGYAMPVGIQGLGFLWVPALALAFFSIWKRGWLKDQGTELADYLSAGLSLTLVFFLTRTWVSEPNVAIVLAMAAVIAAAGRLSARSLHSLWVLPLAFTVFNASLPQMFFLVSPTAPEIMAGADGSIRVARLIARSIVVLPWLVLGWRLALVPWLSKGGAAAHAATPRESLPVTSPRLSVVIPTYNEAGTIADVIQRAMKAMDSVGNVSVELIVVDDDSPDATSAAAGSTGVDIRIIRRSRKSGLASAILDGMARAQGELIAVMDADLQHPPEALPKLYRAIQDGADLAIMSRFVPGARTQGRSLLRRAASRLAVIATHLLLPATRSLRDPVSGFFMLRASLLSGLTMKPHGFKVLPGIIARATSREIREIPYTFGPRICGESKLRAREVVSLLLLLFDARGDARRLRRARQGSNGDSSSPISADPQRLERPGEDSRRRVPAELLSVPDGRGTGR